MMVLNCPGVSLKEVLFCVFLLRICPLRTLISVYLKAPEVIDSYVVCFVF